MSSTDARAAAPGPGTPALAGGRVALRAIAAADAPALLELFGHPDVVRFWGHEALPDLAAAEAYVAAIVEGRETGRLLQWAIHAPGDPTLIGTASLADLDWGHQRAGIGVALSPRWWGRGLAAAAVEVLLRHAFDALQLHRIEAEIDPRHAVSLRLFTRLGFRREGYLRGRYHLHGGWQDSILLARLRTDQAPDPGLVTDIPDGPSAR